MGAAEVRAEPCAGALLEKATEFLPDAAALRTACEAGIANARTAIAEGRKASRRAVGPAAAPAQRGAQGSAAPSLHGQPPRVQPPQRLKALGRRFLDCMGSKMPATSEPIV